MISFQKHKKLSFKDLHWKLGMLKSSFDKNLCKPRSLLNKVKLGNPENYR